MRLREIEDIINLCTYKPNWKVELHVDDTKPYLQVAVKGGTCSVTRRKVDWKSGKTYLSYHMCKQEIVSAVYGAIERAEMHEVREWFRYRGSSIFNPHLDPDALAVLASSKNNFNCRENPMSMEEGK